MTFHFVKAFLNKANTNALNCITQPYNKNDFLTGIPSFQLELIIDRNINIIYLF